MIKLFSASLEKLYDMLSFVRMQAVEAGFTNGFLSKIELAAEETLVNIINHGYDNKETGTIEIHCAKLDDGTGLKIVIRDQGIAFDPVAASRHFDPTVENKPHHDKQIGGYGVYFVMNMMDQIDYKRVDESNILTLIKYL